MSQILGLKISPDKLGIWLPQGDAYWSVYCPHSGGGIFQRLTTWWSDTAGCCREGVLVRYKTCSIIPPVAVVTFYQTLVSTAKFELRNLEFKIHFPVFLDRSNKLDMALTEYLYIKLLSVLHNDSYHVLQYTFLNTV